MLGFRWTVDAAKACCACLIILCYASHFVPERDATLSPSCHWFSLLTLYLYISLLFPGSLIVTTETEKVRLSKETSSARTGRVSKRTSVAAHGEARQTEANRRPSHSIAQRRIRIAPEAEVRMSSREEAKNGIIESPRKSKRRSKGKKDLKINTEQDSQGNDLSTPRTMSSTPDGGVTPAGVRGSKDLRSPGQRKTPGVAKMKIASENDPVPDFMTQTDQYGNATTPRNSKSIENARQIHPSGATPHLHVGKDGKLHEDDDDDGRSGVDACTETLYDSLRLMCCCLAPEEAEPPTKVQVIQHEEPEVDNERPRLLPHIHIEDKGKKCLVLDLDETLVHSSFRAVPGADFVIPVQVRYID
jgi:hypothetical protein